MSTSLGSTPRKHVDERLGELKQRLDDIQASLSAAKKETHQQLQARMNQVAAAAQSATADAAQKVEASSAEAKSRWGAFKSNLDAKKDEIAQRIDARAKEHDLKHAVRTADLAEYDAIDAIDFAELALHNAYLSVLDALDARLYADEMSAAAGS